MSVFRIFVRAVVLAVVMTAVGVAVGAQTASAAPNVCGKWSNEQDLVDSYGRDCRSTWLVDPGVGNLLDRRQLLDADAVRLYRAHGFAKQFLWYAPEQTVTIEDGSHQGWTSCPERLHYGGVCPADAILKEHELLNNFTGGVTLHVFRYHDNTIVRACGNYFVPKGASDEPVPSMTVEKFDDRNRNGVRDAGEPGLAGWTFTIERVASRFGDESAGAVGTVTTGADGIARFEFRGAGPGTYAAVEQPRDGWAATTAARQTFEVNDGVGDAEVAHLRFGNAQTRADLVKADFSLVAPAPRLEAHAPTDLTVRAVLRNDGPADVTATDALDVSVPADCVAEPAHAEVNRALLAGESATVDFPVRVTCHRPSYHPMTFTDHLAVATSGVSDPDPGTNSLAFEHVFPVFDRADITLGGTSVTCPDRSNVGMIFDCTVTAAVGNAGPYGPVGADVTFAVRVPDDCVAENLDGSAAQGMMFTAGESRTVTSEWHVTCNRRSFHEISATAAATLNHLHVEDPAAGNSSGAASTTTQIFEPVDLSVAPLDVRCTERENNTTASACTATVVVRNAGPATDVKTLVNLAITPEPDCTAVPTQPEETRFALDAATSRTVTGAWDLTCTTASRHSVVVQATVRADEPHAEDLRRDNDTTVTRWGPIDVKPRSLPSSVNLGKEGLVPFAVLSTATLNALTDVDVSSLRFGKAGTENTVVRCAAGGEDVNDDGLLDLVCMADTRRTGIDCSTGVALMAGQLTSGVRFEAEDDIKVVPCR